MDSNLQEVINAIEQSEKNEAVLEWMHQITQQEFGLINSLIKTFIPLINDPNYTQNTQQMNKILKALRKLNEWVSQNVLSQMKSNEHFPLALRDYILKFNINEQSGDVYPLLAAIFQSSSFESIANKEFILKLLDDFEYIDDEKIFHQLVSIVIKIQCDFKQANPQVGEMVLDIIQNHPNQRYISESLANIINLGEHPYIKDFLNFIQEIYQKQITFFYSADLKVLIEIIIRQTEQNNEDFSELLLQTLIFIIKSDQYKDLGHRKEGIIEMCSQIKLLSSNSTLIQLSSQIEQILQQQ